MPFRLSVHVYTPSAVLSAMDGPRVGKARFAENERNGQNGAIPIKGAKLRLSRPVAFGLRRPAFRPFICSDFLSSPTPLVQLHVREVLVAGL